MKIVVAIDSFKGSLSSMEAGKIVKKGIQRKRPDAEVIIYPLADGGEGTVEALVEGMKGRVINTQSIDPLGRPIDCRYGIIDRKKLAIIEIAEVAGLTLVDEESRNPLDTTTYGVGILIADAIDKGCREFIIGLGGSATNDAGIGMLQALGYTFRDKNNKPVGNKGIDLKDIKYIDSSGVDSRLRLCKFNIACDVNNLLYGPLGATEIYGPQKGASKEIVKELELYIKNFSNIVSKHYGKDYSTIPGTGAAGGLGYAFLTFLNGKLEAGRDIILREIDIEKDIVDADYVVTGEGRLDFQTAMGKGPIGVAKLGKKHGAKTIALSGSVSKDVKKCNQEGIDACISIIQEPSTLEESMKPQVAYYNLITTVEQLFSIL